MVFYNYVIIFEVNIVSGQKQAQFATIFLFFISFYFIAPLLRCP